MSDVKRQYRNFQGRQPFRRNRGWRAGGSHDNRSVCRQTERVAAIPRETQDQDDELLALASIYDSEVFCSSTDTYTGRFVAQIVLAEPLNVVVNETPAVAGIEIATRGFPVRYLPPITLSFRLPPDYPSKREPNFRLTCNWLNKKQLSSLCKTLDEIWEENKGSVILYQWTEALTECLPLLGIRDTLDLSWTLEQLKEEGRLPCSGEAERISGREPQSHFDVRKPNRYRMPQYGDHRAVTDTSDVASILPTLRDYDQMEAEKKFQTETFNCKVCFEQRLGSQSLRFKGCDHVYCQACMKNYFEVQIREGNVGRLECPEDKCTSQATPAQIRELVGSELFAKYDEMLLSSTLDSMSDVVYCPRTACQCPVLIETDVAMGTCPACFFVFCVYCRMASHGVEPCRIKSKEFRQLYEDYTNGSAQQKATLEAKYGKVQLRRVVETTLSAAWVDNNSKACPQCHAHIEKIDGCNKMLCWKCGRPFCWSCMAKLDPVHPYQHYEDPKTGCYGRLFPFQIDFDDEEDDGFAGEFGEFL